MTSEKVRSADCSLERRWLAELCTFEETAPGHSCVGPTVKQLSGVSLDKCIARCKSNARCTAVTMKAKAKKCTLKTKCTKMKVSGNSNVYECIKPG